LILNDFIKKQNFAASLIYIKPL